MPNIAGSRLIRQPCGLHERDEDEIAPSCIRACRQPRARRLARLSPSAIRRSPRPRPAAHAWAAGGERSPRRSGRALRHLANGMRYALRHNATPPHQTSLRLRIDAGSLEEQDDQRGLAHFIEHMAFNGSTHVPEGEFVHRLGAARACASAPTPTPRPNSPRPSTSSICPRPMPTRSTRACSCCARRRAKSASRRGLRSRARHHPVRGAHARRAGALRDLRRRARAIMLPGQLLPNRIPIGSSRSDRAPRQRDALRRLLRRLLPARARHPDRGRRLRPRRRWRPRSAPASATGSGRGPAGRESRSRRGRRRAPAACGCASNPATAPARPLWVSPPDLRPDTRANSADELTD